MQDTNSNSGQGGQQKPSLSWTQPAAAAPAAATSHNDKKVTPPTTHKSGSAAQAAAAASNTGTYVGIFVAGVVVGALIGWGFTSPNNSGSVATTASSTNETASTTTSGSNTTGTKDGVGLSGATIGTTGALTLASSQTAGFAVVLTKIAVSQPTWIVVYEDRSGTPDSAIGAGLFFPDSTSGTIELLRATLPGQSYLVGQSLDDGDKIFSTQNDKPVRDSKGNALFTEFVAK